MKVVIFAGGYGTRMWPASRKSYPKQFFPVVKGKSFFQNTVARFKKSFDPKDIFVSTEEPYVPYVHKQSPEIPKENIIVEPERKDMLGAVGLVSATIEKKFPGEVMFFSWSDHLIGNEKRFLKAVKAASEYTKKTGKPVSIDSKPTFPSVHNGWLEQGKIVDRLDGYKIYETVQHFEKPNEVTAKRFLKAGNYLIHTGYGAWRSDLMLSYYKKYAPKVYEGLKRIMDAMGTKHYESVLKSEYGKFEKVSIDFGLFEKLPKGLRLNIPVAFGWRDAGTWQLFFDAMLDPGERDVVEGDSKTLFIDSFKNLVVGLGGRIITIVGLKNVAVIDTKDALLVCDLDDTEKVKELFKELEKNMPGYVN